MIPLHDDNPTSIFPYVTIAIIVICALVFLWELSLGPATQMAIYAYGAIPAVVVGGKSLPPEVDMIPAWSTIFTSMFMHGGWMHIIGNMLYLWIFGNNVEDAMGHKRFAVFYLVCGVLAFLAHAMTNVNSEVPTVGASGAISGVLGAYLLLHPHARVLVLIPLGFFLYTTRFPAAVVLVLWFGLQLLSSAMTPAGEGGVAFGAHIGGFVAGMALIPFFKYKNVRLFTQRR
jgi:membrane associated rhomboid family serine protease